MSTEAARRFVRFNVQLALALAIGMLAATITTLWH
jgi:hypothetical protein